MKNTAKCYFFKVLFRKEIDFIVKSKGKIVPVESKYDDEISEEDIKPILGSMK